MDRLNDDQKAVVQHRGSPLLVFAAAGTGKTQALTARIADLVQTDDIPPERIIALTFTRKAAAEMKRRAAERCGCEESRLKYVGTFHSVCMTLLRMERLRSIARECHGVECGVSTRFSVLSPENASSILEECMERVRGVIGSDVAAYMRQLEAWRNQGLEPEAAPLHASPHSAFQQSAAKLYGAYREECSRQDVTDFGDMILHVVTLLQRCPQLRVFCQTQLFSHLLVDEFQDTNPVQMRLIELLCQRTCSMMRDDDIYMEDMRLGEEKLMVVGDDYQAIHEWRGATVKNIVEFTDAFPKAKVVHLKLNYRSLPFILEAASSLISHNPDQHHKLLLSTRNHITDNDKRGTDMDTDVATNADKIVIKDHACAWSEAKEVAEEIARIRTAHAIHIRQGGRHEDKHTISVLYRINAQSQPVEEALTDAGIPYVIKGSLSFFGRSEVNDCLAYARLLVNPRSDTDFIRAVSTPARGIGKVAFERLRAFPGSTCLWDSALKVCENEKQETWRGAKKLREFVRAFRESRASCASSSCGTACELLRDCLDNTGYLPNLNSLASSKKTGSNKKEIEEAQGRLENVNALIALLQRFGSKFESGSGHGSGLLGYSWGPDDTDSACPAMYALQEFVSRCALEPPCQNESCDNDDSNSSSDAVTLMTLHSSKGLEFSSVFMIGVCEDVLPYYRAVQERRVHEERRLCYVGVTRARDRLYISHPRKRMLFGKNVPGEPSRFIKELARGAMRP